MTEAIAPHKGKVRVWFMDEARFGQQGTITDIWAPTGSRPRAVRQTRYDWVYLYRYERRVPWIGFQRDHPQKQRLVDDAFCERVLKCRNPKWLGGIEREITQSVAKGIQALYCRKHPSPSRWL